MGRIDRIVLWAIGGVSFLVLGAAALVYANDWWLSGLMTVSILCWLTGVLAAIYSRQEQRPFLVGALVTSLLYILLGLGPWFRGQVGPWLLTSQALAHVETKWLGRPQPQPAAQQIWTTGFPYPVLMDSGLVTTGIPTSYAYSPGVSGAWVAPTPTNSRFIDIGHWLFAWIAAAVGGLAAARIAHKRSSPPSKETIP